MSAVLKSVQKTLFQEQLEAVMHYGAPGAHLEAPEVPRWVAELGDTNLVSEFSQAISDYDKDEKEWNRLLAAVMTGPSLEQASEFIDLCRARFLDSCIAQQQRMIDREMGLL